METKLVSSVTAMSKPFDLEYQFRISRIKGGNFKNLWRLEARTPQDAAPVEIIDADMLGTVIDRIRWIFEQDGL